MERVMQKSLWLSYPKTKQWLIVFTGLFLITVTGMNSTLR